MADHECLSSETIEGLRASSRKDIEAARLLDCAAVLRSLRADSTPRPRPRDSHSNGRGPTGPEWAKENP